MSLRGLPAVGVLLNHPLLAAYQGCEPLADCVRAEIAAERTALLAGGQPRSADTLAEAAVGRLKALLDPRLRPVVNATGVVINTNLGRAPLSATAIQRLVAVAGGYSNLEMDLASGERGSRHVHVEALLQRLTGAEAALVVNNCAAAVLLLTDTFARGREVVVSRGQLIEIGGSFRLPEVLTASGAKLREVGTTNRTYLRDYAAAIGPETGMLLLSHTSNYRIVGFTAEVDRADLAALGRERGVVTVEDQGNGLLTDLTAFGLPAEQTVQASVATGLDVVAFSGDKLLGGPQAGILVGKAELIARLKKNPMTRALRPDKLALAALEGTLVGYLNGEHVPVLAMLAKPLETLRQEAEALAVALNAGTEPGVAAVGGGTMPEVEVPTHLVVVEGKGLDALAKRLRTGDPAVVARIAENKLLLDPRTFVAGDHDRIVAAFKRARA